MSVKILIIEDDISIGNLEQDVLEQTGYQVLRAYSGTEAVLLLKSCRPDLILLDLTMDAISHEVCAAGVPVMLTRTEYAILKLLMHNDGQVIAKSVLLERISEDTPDCTESSLKTHISHLRGKLRAAAGKDYIEAVLGIGFRLKA